MLQWQRLVSSFAHVNRFPSVKQSQLRQVTAYVYDITQARSWWRNTLCPMGFYAQCIMNLDDIFEKEFDTQNRPCFDRLRCQGMAAQMSLPLIGLQVAARGFTRPQMALLAPVLMRDA